MKILLPLLFFLLMNTAYSQVAGNYVSYSSSDYFPTKLYLKKDLTFLYKECLDDNHTDNEYFEKGTYKVQGDTLYLLVNKVGFDCETMISETINKIAIHDKNNLSFLRGDGSIYLKLSKKKFRHKRIFSGCFD